MPEPVDASAAAARRRPRRVWLVALLVLLAAVGFARARLLAGSVPYVLHEDELIATRRAADMLETGDLDPRFFRYPSLTIYLTAAAFLVGNVADGEAPAAPIGRVAPTYERTAAASAPRVCWIALSLLAMAGVGYLAARTFDAPALLFGAPLVLALSTRYLMMSWTYVNVDLVGTFVCVAALVHVVRTRESEHLLHRALVPGLLCGAAVGSKYYLGLVGLPAAILLFSDRRRLAPRVAVIVVATVAGFLVTTPFALADPAFFVDQVLFEVRHYQSGHRGAEGEPGLSQLVYYAGRTAAEFGPWLSLLGLVGLVWGLVTRPRDTLLVASFPLALLVFLCLQRVHFIRNFLVVYALFPIFIAHGGSCLWRSVAARAPRPARAVLALALIAVLVPTVPWPRVRSAYSEPADSRNGAARWIEEHVAPGTRVFVAEELMLDTRRLAGSYDVVAAPLVAFVRPAMDEVYAAGGASPVFVVPELPEGSPIAEHFGRPVRRQLERLDARWSGGSRELPRKPPRLLHLGDPLLSVRTLPVGAGSE